MTDSPELDIVICTYANPVMLDLVLSALEGQHGTDDTWRVTVIDNNSPAETEAVVTQHIARGLIPGLRRFVELEQGLTPARLRGVRATTGRWIAFVDDDCILDEHWVANTLAFARANPACGGFGGRVVPEYDNPPAVIGEYGWAFAEQDLGDVAIEVDCLVGAGMVLRREVLAESGWPDGPFFQDRVGSKLVSGGDVEIAFRVTATGKPLWYTPSLALRHLIPAHRTTMPYLVRIIRGLGVSTSISGALTAPGSRRAWVRTVVHDLRESRVRVLYSAKRILRGGPDDLADVMLTTSYELGRWIGATRVVGLMVRGKCDFFGRAYYRRHLDGHLEGAGDAVRPD
jgi:GT2 family glycosyltransferase